MPCLCQETVALFCKTIKCFCVLTITKVGYQLFFYITKSGIRKCRDRITMCACCPVAVAHIHQEKYPRFVFAKSIAIVIKCIIGVFGCRFSLQGINGHYHCITMMQFTDFIQFCLDLLLFFCREQLCLVNKSCRMIRCCLKIQKWYE